MDQSAIFSLSWRDLVKSIITSLSTAVFLTLGEVVNNKIKMQDFTITENDLKVLVYLTVFTFIGDLSRRFLTDEEGKLLGKV